MTNTAPSTVVATTDKDTTLYDTDHDDESSSSTTEAVNQSGNEDLGSSASSHSDTVSSGIPSKTKFPVYILSETYEREKHKLGEAEFLAMMELMEANGGWETSFGHKKKSAFLINCNRVLHSEGGKLNK